MLAVLLWIHITRLTVAEKDLRSDLKNYSICILRVLRVILRLCIKIEAEVNGTVFIEVIFTCTWEVKSIHILLDHLTFLPSHEVIPTEITFLSKLDSTLTSYLKNKSKVQGDWGEQVLENILESSGLRKDEDYFTQHNVKGEGNENLRPDVIVKCPGDKFIVIDSKVSLTAYLDYVAAEDPSEQKKAAQENLTSIRKHIDELSAKNYEKLVGNTISHVLMFIPNEGSYILALQTDPKIAQYAFSKNVLLINPTNLMMSLKLIYNIWQSERQTRNVENIVAESTGLYEKFAGFLETFTDVGTKIQSLQKAFDTAENQLCTGNGNLVRRVEKLKEKGILPKKSLPDKYLNKARE